MAHQGGQSFAPGPPLRPRENLGLEWLIMAAKLPTGSTPSDDGDPRPRAQVSYEGEDAFSAVSLSPERRAALKNRQTLNPGAPGNKEEMQVNELRATNNQGVVGFLRRIFAK